MTLLGNVIDAAMPDLRREYLDLTRSIERLHRRFLDVLRAELNRLGIREINGVQALLLANIGDEEIAVRDLMERGYYHGSNVSYNIKKLTEMGFLAQRRSPHDRRSISLSLTDKARTIVTHVKALEERMASQLSENNIDGEALAAVGQALRGVERTWTDYIQFSRR